MTLKQQHYLALWRLAALLSCVAVMGSCGGGATGTPTAAPTIQVTSVPPSIMDGIIPKPVSVNPTGGEFLLTDTAGIYVEAGNDEIKAIGQYLADRLNSSTGFDLQVLTATGAPANGNIYLTLSGADPALGEEGYLLTITPELVTLAANQPAGLFHGIQTIRQLLPPAIESGSLQPGPWEMATGTIRDYPRFAWRGTMLDVARHFFSVRDVTRYIDLLAYYKINRLHLHLADDQGWRIEIKSWPNLAAYGGSLEVGGTPGGYYSQDDYSYIVHYAQSRYITIVPEIDMPGHTNAALASYPELNCSNAAPDLYTGMEVGFSSLCVSKDITYTFVEDVVREIAALTPGPYFHIGGDEAQATNEADYIKFVERVQAIVRAYGKQVVGWEEIARARLLSTSIPQHWNPGEGLARQAVQQGLKIIMSPADKAYMDMKYDQKTKLGLDWAGYISVESAYSWEPVTMVSGMKENNILGLEAPLWSETLQTLGDIEYMAFPRLAGYAEIGWSPQAGRDWDEYRLRLAMHGPRWEVMDVNFYRTPEVLWK